MYKKTWDESQLVKAVANNTTVSDVLRELGLKIFSRNYKTVYRYVDKLCLDTSHWKGQAHGMGISVQKSFPLKDVMVQNSTYGRTHLKRRLIKEGLLEYKCTECGNDGWWRGKPVALILDHINGISNDHRLENLRFLCPMCNAQTDTFCGKNIKYNIKKYKCKSCGGIISKESKSGLCVKCVKQDPLVKKKIRQAILAKKYICKTCGNPISSNSKHNICRPCARLRSRKSIRPPYSQLISEIKETSYSAVGRKYGVSDNAIRKWVRAYEKDLLTNQKV